jgi:hypothetical protein
VGGGMNKNVTSRQTSPAKTRSIISAMRSAISTSVCWSKKPKTWHTTSSNERFGIARWPHLRSSQFRNRIAGMSPDRRR